MAARAGNLLILLLLVSACAPALLEADASSAVVPRALPQFSNITGAADLADLPAIGNPRNPPDPLSFPSWEAFVAAIDLWGGTAIADYDVDGLPDIAVSRKGTTALYHNEGNLSFVDVGVAAGLSATVIGMGVTFVDADADGWLDLHVVAFGAPDSLYHNEGDGTFVDIAPQLGIASDRHGAGAAWGDYDRDGCLDLYVPAYLHQENQLFHARCDGSGTFEDVSDASGTNDGGWGFQALWSDYDGDDDLDLLVINDFGPDVLYRNNDNGTFSDISAQAHLDQQVAGGMGAAMGDYDTDGDLDLFVTNYYEDGLYTNLGDGTFHESLAGSPINDPLVGWGANFFDYDNDADLDLYLANGFIFEYTHAKDQPDRFFENVDGSFVDATDTIGVADTGVTHGSAVADLDGDGALELYSINIDGPSILYRRAPTANGFLQLQLHGTVSDPQGIGASVLSTIGGRTMRTELRAGGSYLSMDEPIVHLGLGSAAVAERIEIHWPSGATQVLTDVPANSRIVVEENASLIANAGSDRTVGTSVPVVLDGTQSTSSLDGAQLLSKGTFRWIVGAPGPDQMELLGPTVEVSIPSAGRIPVILEVTDSSGATDSESLTLEVADTLAPVVVLGPPRTVGAGRLLELDAGATVDDDPLLRTLGTFAWEVIDPLGFRTTQEGFTFALLPTIPGAYVITLKVTDPSGNVGSGVLQLQVTDASAPHLSFDPAWEVDEDSPLLLVANATDNDPTFDQASSLHWSVPSAEGATAGTGPRFVVRFSTPGQYPLVLRATDAAGNTAAAEATVQVHDRTAPTLFLGEGWSIPEDTLSTLSVPLLLDNDPLFGSTGTVRWRVHTASGVLERFGPTVSLRIDDPGELTLRISATDREGNSAIAEGTLHVVDRTAPLAQAGGDERLRPGDVALLSARASTDNDPQLLRDGAAHWHISGPGGNVTLDGWDVVMPLTHRGVYVVTLTVDDPAGNVGTDHQQLIVAAPADHSAELLWRQLVLLSLVALPCGVLAAVLIGRRMGG